MKIKIQSISSWFTIIGFPLIILGAVLGYFQLSDYLIKADLSLEFVYHDQLYFKIINDTKRTAEEPYYGFNLMDMDGLNLDEPGLYVLPIPFGTTTFIKPKSSQGPVILMGNLGKAEHKYFGSAMITCKNCKFTKRYMLYIDTANLSEGFYILSNNENELNDTLNAFRKTKDLNIFPLDRRIKFNKAPILQRDSGQD